MECENTFCIYWADEECTLKTIALDDRGCCQECLYVRLTDHELEQYRDKTIRYYDRKYDHWE